MSMNKTIANLGLIKDKISDFKIELGRIKDEFTSAISALQAEHVQQATESNDKYSINLYSDIDKAVKYFTKTEDFSFAVEKINQLVKNLGLDLSLQVNLSNNFDIANFLNIFIPEYGFSKLYKNTKDQVLLDFDNIFNSDEAKAAMEKPVSAPSVARPPLSEEGITIFEEEIEEEAPEETVQLEGAQPDQDDAVKASKEDIFRLEQEIDNLVSIPQSDIISPPEVRYADEYYIRSFIAKIDIGTKSFKREFFAPVSLDGKFLATKSGRLIFSTTEMKVENLVSNFASKAVDEKPKGFLSWKKAGGNPKRSFFDNLPQIGKAGSSRDDGDDRSITTANLEQAVIAHNLNYSSHFFTREETPLMRRFSVAEDKLKADLKTDLNLFSILGSIYPDFLNLKNQDMILFIDETASPHQLVIDKNISLEFNNFVLQKISEVKKSLESAYTSAANSKKIVIAESSRYENAKKIDDLISACKIRDKIIYSKYISLKNDPATRSIRSFDAQSLDRLNIEEILICNLLRNSNTNIGSELMGLTQLICFASSNYINSFAANMVRGHSGKVDTQKFFLDEDLITEAFDNFASSFRTQLSSKINMFFSSSIVDGSTNLYCRYMASSIQLSGLYINAYNFAAKPVRLGWNYISCPTCKKDIYYSKYKDAPPGSKSELVPLLSSGMKITEEKAQAFLDPSELSDYEEERYSFFKQNGQLITTQELRSASQQVGKNWDDILKMISSNNPAEHNAGIKERQNLLKSMGARIIKRRKGATSASVFTYKTKCPFSDGSLPSSIQFAREISKKDISITDFSCGLSLNVDELVKSDRKIEAYELHSAPFDSSIDPEVKLNEAINASIQRGIISEADRESFLNELRKRRSGGWKFSNTMFRCPCRPTSELQSGSVTQNNFKYKYIASPISGFFTKEFADSGIIHRPTAESGDLHEVEDYTSSYIICGELTSISSFCRDTSDPNSLYAILRSKIRESMIGSNRQSQLYISSFIDTLLQLGVDFNDILPFIDRIYSEEFKTTISSSHKNILNSIIKKAVEVTDMDLPSHERESQLSRAGVLGDLKLVCSNGHKFKIYDSIKFGQTHTGYSITKKFASGSGYRQIMDISKKNGTENLIGSLDLQIPGSASGQTIISRVDKNNIPYNMKNFTEWNGIWDSKKGLSEYYYVDGNGNYYIFNSRGKDVIWGDGNRSESVMPFVTRDSKTNLLVRSTPLKVSDEAGDEEEGGSGPTLIDKIQAENYSSALDDIGGSISSASMIETTANERAILDVYYSPLAVVLQSALVSIKDFCNRATSTYLTFPLHGKPTTLKNEDQILPIVKDIITKFYVNQASNAGEDQETIRENLDGVVRDAFDNFTKNYLDQIRVQDLRFLNMLEPSVSPIEKSTISRMILISVNSAIGSRSYDLTDISSRIFDPKFREKMESELFSSDLGQKIDEIVKLIKSNIEEPKATAVKGLIQGAEQPMISKLQGSEYIGRVLMMSSALFLSESISRLYRKYLNKSSSKYIGVDIGINLSSPGKIVRANPGQNDGSIFGLSDSEINSIPTSFPLDQLFDELSEEELEDLNIEQEDIEAYQNLDDYQSYVIEEIDRLSALIVKLEKQNEELKGKNPEQIKKNQRDISRYKGTKKSLNDTRDGITSLVNEFVESHSSLFLQFFDEIKEEMMKIQTACTNYKYTEKAVFLMRESLVKKIEIDKSMDDSARKITQTIINRCITNSPITTISLAGGDKYHAYYSGESSVAAGGPFRVLPLFNADQVIIPGLPTYAPPVYALSGSNNSYSNLGLQITQSPPAKKHVILYKDISGDFIEPYSVSLPEEVILSGWKVGLVDSKKFAIKSVKEISLFYHPYTLGVLSDGTRVKPSVSDSIVGFVNSYTNFNSIAGFNFGPQATRSGTVSLYPTPYAHSDKNDNGGTHIGLFLPIKYSRGQEELKQGYSKVAPFFDAKIPLEIPTDSPGNTIKINISDFLVRDPPEKAQQILTQISQRYIEYKEDVSKVRSASEKKRLREECKKDIAELFDRYRHLPYRVTNTASSSRVSYEGKLGGEDPSVSSAVTASVTPYIPMADFVTCSRILNYEEFSPEFGGHTFWNEGDTDSAPTIRGAVEQMIIDVNNLEDLANIMNEQLNDNEIKITGRDLLDPHHGVFDKIYQKVKKDKTSKAISRGSVTEEDIIRETIKLIKTITTYNVGDDYTPLSSTNDPVVRERLSHSYRADTFWSKQPENRPLTETSKKFGRWISSIGKFYPVREGSRDGDQPGARIKVMSELFPFNKEDGSGRTESLRMIQDPSSSSIISQDDFNYASFLYGSLHSMGNVYYPGGSPEEAAKFLQDVKKEEGKASMTISAVKYAAGISEFFTSNIIMGLRKRIQLEKERAEVAKPISKKASLVKSSPTRIRVAPLDAVDNIRMAGMISLLSMFTK